MHIYHAKELIKKFEGKGPICILDLGCSIGTYAIEFALEGHKTVGLDLDPKALEVAKQLADREGCRVEWLCEDACNFLLSKPVDFIVCFDLLEHLKDETIRGMFRCVRKNLKPDGVFVYHTFPTEYDHVFYSNLCFKQFTSKLSLPLIPFKRLSDVRFTKAVKYYSHFLDLFSLILLGKTHRQLISNTVHPNPLSKERVDSFCDEAGLEVVFSKMGIEDFNPLKPGQGEVAIKHFPDKTIAQRSLWGAVRVRNK